MPTNLQETLNEQCPKKAYCYHTNSPPDHICRWIWSYNNRWKKNEKFKGTATDMRYFAKSKFSRSLVR